MIKLNLDITLKQIISSIDGYDNYIWYIIYYYGYGLYGSKIERYLEENKVWKVPIDDLLVLEDNVNPHQIIDLSLVAFLSEKELLNLDYDARVKHSVINIELVDSSYWELTAPQVMLDVLKISFIQYLR